ncbi:hypothetical protein DPMN_050064 [Dreissena polymorpha]|uniref:Uncharacterized protein n=1 Tax=Dreissena polymorpha TaxID=45954 RepID=A0A9D4CFF2_DREPO|nr:hypothetical protein DPMN_050064 [Dreissena polymorpha]
MFHDNSGPQDIIRTIVLTKFHEEVLTRINSATPGGHGFQQNRTIFKLKNDKPPGGNFFQPTETFFEFVQDIIRTNLLAKKMNRTWLPYIIGTNLLTKFHEDRA